MEVNSLKTTKERIRKRLLKKYNRGDSSPLKLTSTLDSGVPLISVIMNFVAAHPSFSRSLFELHGNVPSLGNRLGKGEVLFYFIFDDSMIGGSSSSIDVFKVSDDNEPQPFLEIKAAKREGDHYLDFFMGMDEVPCSLRFFQRVLELYEKNDRDGKLLLPTNFAHISKRKLEELKVVANGSYKKIEEQYFDELISGPIGKKTFLFFDQETNLPIFHGKLNQKQLMIERISGGLTRLSFKP